MSRKYIHHWSYLDCKSPECEEIELSDFILRKLESHDIEDGIIEEMKKELKNIRASYSKFLELQFDKGLLTLNELLDVLGVYHGEDDESFELEVREY